MKARLLRMVALIVPALLAGCDSNYPFVGKWALENPKDPKIGLCGFMPGVKITRAHVVAPLAVLTITDIKNDSGRWILSVNGNGGPAPPVVLKDVTAQSLVLADVAGMMACKMKKTGECTNLLCD